MSAHSSPGLRVHRPRRGLSPQGPDHRPFQLPIARAGRREGLEVGVLQGEGFLEEGTWDLGLWWLCRSSTKTRRQDLHTLEGGLEGGLEGRKQ